MTEQRLRHLNELAPEALRQVIFERLQGRTSLGPPMDPRVGDLPYVWLVDEYDRFADQGLQRRMTAIASDFLKELDHVEAWSPDARANLLDYIQHCGHGLIDDLMTMVREKTLCRAIGKPAHAGLLKCLMALEHRISPQFWMEQFDTLGDDYGGLIFAALLDHDLPVAVEHLPRLASSETARKAIVVACIDAIDRFGQTATFDAIRKCMDRDPDFREAFLDDFRFLEQEFPSACPARREIFKGLGTERPTDPVMAAA